VFMPPAKMQNGSARGSQGKCDIEPGARKSALPKLKSGLAF
jgi:hypothetical protein